MGPTHLSSWIAQGSLETKTAFLEAVPMRLLLILAQASSLGYSLANTPLCSAYDPMSTGPILLVGDQRADGPLTVDCAKFYKLLATCKC